MLPEDDGGDPRQRLRDHAGDHAAQEGVGQGQIAVSGTLARVGSIGGTSAYPAVISLPADANRSILRLGTSGTATVFAENAGPIGLIARIVLWVQSYAAYL